MIYNLQGIDLTGNNIQIHTYQLQDDGPGTEELDDEDLAAANHWLLPSTDFHGMWDSLVFDDDIKGNVITFFGLVFCKFDKFCEAWIHLWVKLIHFYNNIECCCFFFFF